MLKQEDHICLDVLEAQKLSIDDIYKKAMDCPLCIELGDYLHTRKQRRTVDINNASVNDKITEKQLDKLLDRHDLYLKDRVFRSFNEVINNTISNLKPGYEMKLLSTGELLEARHPYAFHELMQAIKRGVSINYVISENKILNDIDILTANLSYVIKDSILCKRVSVEYSNVSTHNMKDVFYFDENGEVFDRLVEISFHTQQPFQGTRRLWVRINEKERNQFIADLQAVHRG